MRKTITSAAIAVALCAMGQDLARVEIKTVSDVDAIESVPEWRRGGTNGVTISVCTGSAVLSHGIARSNILLVRTLEFDGDGRLVRASPVRIMPGGASRLPNFDEVRDSVSGRRAERMQRERSEMLRKMQKSERDAMELEREMMKRKNGLR